MWLSGLVKLLAQSLSQLSSEEASKLKDRGLDQDDVKTKLCSRLVDVFWSIILRNSPHFSEDSSKRIKNGRYSASSIMRDVDESTRKKVSLCDRDVRSKMCNSLLLENDPVSMVHLFKSSKYTYSKERMHVDIAVKLHKQILRRKGLDLEATALEFLLELFDSISHIPSVKDEGISCGSLNCGWIRFKSHYEVLELLSHLSSEPVGCLHNLSLSRYILYRKGFGEVRHIEMKLLLDHLQCATSSNKDSLKWMPSGFWNAEKNPRNALEKPRHLAVKCISDAFEYALGSLVGSTMSRSTDCGELNDGNGNFLVDITQITKATDAPLRLEWLPPANTDCPEQKVHLLSDEKVQLDVHAPELEKTHIHRDKVSDWLPRSFEISSDLFKTTKTKSYPHKSPKMEQSPSFHGLLSSGCVTTTFFDFETSDGFMVSHYNLHNALCYINKKSMPKIFRHDTWQVTGSFDAHWLNNTLRNFPVTEEGMKSVQSTIIEVMMDRTLLRFSKGPYPIIQNDSRPINWYMDCLMCLQGFESTCFQSEAFFAYYNRKFNVMGDFLHEAIAQLVNSGDMSIKAFYCMVLSCFNKSEILNAPNSLFESVIMKTSSDTRLLIVNPVIAPWHHRELKLFLSLRCTSLIESETGFKTFENALADIIRIGTMVRFLKCFVTFIKHYEMDENFSQVIGVSLISYGHALERVLYEYERDVTIYVNTNLQPQENDVVSVLTLLLAKNISQWFVIVEKFYKLTFQDEFRNLEYFVIPRGIHFIDKMSICFSNNLIAYCPLDSFNTRCMLNCFLGVIRPYMEFLSLWLTKGVAKSFHYNEFLVGGEVDVMMLLKPMATLIKESADFCQFLAEYYYSFLPAGNCPIFVDKFPNENGESETLGFPSDTQFEITSSLNAIVESIYHDIILNHDALNLVMIGLLKREYDIISILEGIYDFLLFNRIDLMDEFINIIEKIENRPLKLSSTRLTAEFQRLTNPKVIVSIIEISVLETLNQWNVAIHFSTQLFGSYLFDDNNSRLYNAIFQQLCTLEIGVRNLKRIYGWFLCNFKRGSHSNFVRNIPTSPRIIYINSRFKILCSIARDMYSIFTSIYWYMKNIAIPTPYKEMLKKIKFSTKLPQVIAAHRSFVKAVYNNCFASGETKRCSMLFHVMASCISCFAQYLENVELNGNFIDETDTFQTFESVIVNIFEKFKSAEKEFVSIFNASRNCTLINLADVIESTKGRHDS